jgi:hypothetical protein
VAYPHFGEVATVAIALQHKLVRGGALEIVAAVVQRHALAGNLCMGYRISDAAFSL